MVFRDQNLSVGFAFWYSSVIASRSSHDRASYICIIVHSTHIHTHKHIHAHSTCKIVLGLITYIILKNKHTNERIIFMSCSFGV